MVEWNYQNIAIAGAAIVTPIVGFAWWLGVFQKIQVNKSVFPGGTYIYSDWRGPLRNIRQPFDKIQGDLALYQSEVGSGAPPVDQTVPMGIYYDDPHNLKNPDDFRCCAGFLINSKAIQS